MSAGSLSLLLGHVMELIRHYVMLLSPPVFPAALSLNVCCATSPSL